MKERFSHAVPRNPLDEMARKSFGVPVTVKGYLASQNPRPAGLVLKTTSPISFPWPWDSLTDAQWAEEMRGNNGNIISVLLRHPTTTSKSSFLSLFDQAESEYHAILKRLKWAWVKRDKNAFANKVLCPLQPVFETLIDDFVQWSTEHRQMVWTALSEIASEEQYLSGNAKKDLERLGVDWV